MGRHDNQKLTLDEWMQALNNIAGDHGHTTNQDVEAWQGDYDNGLTPEEAWENEWGDE